MHDRRSTARVDVLGAVQAEVLVPQPARVTQISRTGMQIETPCPLQLDAVHEFRLALGERSLVVKGRIAHAHVSDVDRTAMTYLSGIEFVAVAPAVRAAIAEYVDRVLGQRRRE